MRAAHLAAALVFAALFAGLLAPSGRSDGDPASDYLLGQKVFLPFDAKIPQADQQRLVGTVTQATAKGYPIRVAVIWSDYDLGSVTSLWRKPQLYARFLSAELGLTYKGRLLVVMPNGFGYHYPKHGSTVEYAILKTIPIVATPTGLVQAATTASARLAAGAGVHVAAPKQAAAPSNRTGSDRLEIVVAVVAALLIGLALRLLVRRRAAARS